MRIAKNTHRRTTGRLHFSSYHALRCVPFHRMATWFQ
jgi:hypothetical protein